MARDLTDLMREAAEADEAALAGVDTTGPLARAADRIRRRRRVRHVQETAVAAAAVVAVGAAVVLGGAVWRGPSPAATPSPTPSPTVTAAPTPSPTPTSEPTPTAEDVPLTVTRGVPPYRPLTADVLRSSGRGWVTWMFRPTTGDDAGKVLLFVASPAGDVYRAADPQIYPDPSWSVWAFRLVTWEAGTSTVVAEVTGSDPDGLVRIDLLSGATTAEPLGTPGPARFESRAADGSEVWLGRRGATWVVWVVDPEGSTREVYVGDVDVLAQPRVDPSGRYMLVGESGAPRVLDLTTGTTRRVVAAARPGESCDPTSWTGPGLLLVQCTRPGVDEVFPVSAVVLDVSGEQPTQVSEITYGPDEPARIGKLTWVGPDRVFAERPEAPPGSDVGLGCLMRPWWFDSTGRPTSELADTWGISGPIQADAQDGTVYVGEIDGCAFDRGRGGLLAAIDPSGAVRVLVPPLPAAEGGEPMSFVLAG